MRRHLAVGAAAVLLGAAVGQLAAAAVSAWGGEGPVLRAVARPAVGDPAPPALPVARLGKLLGVRDRSEGARPLRPAWKLRGTVHGDGPLALACVESPEGKVRTARPGDLLGDYALVAVEHRRVLLRSGHDEVYLVVGEGVTGPTPPPSARQLDGAAVLSRARFEQVQRDFLAQASSLHLVPAFEAGRATGLKLVSLASTNVLHELGFRRGDVVEAVNGVSLTNPDAVLGLLERLRSAREFQVRLVRAGVPTELRVSVE